ncbi:MAG: TetR/AcrR family transcriptional regulator, partial [Clostridia bacterium]|nr:TetR/AcrR family transcriptional regulator [Clostridia bacterium]
DLREKRRMEQEDLINKRKDEVIAAALEVFKKSGIENTKMTDIAEKAQIGVASVYRYFKTKPEIVIEAACKVWDDEIAVIYDHYTSDAFGQKSGISQVREILEVFIKLYTDHQDFFKFLHEFDSYVIKEGISKEKLKAYEKRILDIKPILIHAIERGKKDGTVSVEINEEQFYFSITHALMSLCQKLIISGHVLESDEFVLGLEQIRTIIDMAVKYIG